MRAIASGKWTRWLAVSAMGVLSACAGRDDDNPPETPDSGTPEGGTSNPDAPGNDEPETGEPDDASSDSVTPPDDTPPPLYEQSPIVFAAFDPPGTFFFSLENRTPKIINDNYSVVWTKMSPSRKRIAQLTDGTSGPNSVVEIHDIASSSPLIRSFENPGAFLGWASEDALLFALGGTQGVALRRLDGTERSMPFPDWVSRDSTGPLGSALSPDAKSAAFLTWTKGQPAAPDGFALFIANTETGAVTNIWPIPANQWPGRVIWAPDGTVVYYSFAKPSIMTTKAGSPSLSTPIELPFRPCEFALWVTPNTLHLKESKVVGDTSQCSGSWLIDTDGSNLRQRSRPPPVALSPDGLKILLLIGDELAVADPDGASEMTIRGLPRAHVPAW